MGSSMMSAPPEPIDEKKAMVFSSRKPSDDGSGAVGWYQESYEPPNMAAAHMRRRAIWLSNRSRRERP